MGNLKLGNLIIILSPPLNPLQKFEEAKLSVTSYATKMAGHRSCNCHREKIIAIKHQTSIEEISNDRDLKMI